MSDPAEAQDLTARRRQRRREQYAEGRARERTVVQQHQTDHGDEPGNRILQTRQRTWRWYDERRALPSSQESLANLATRRAWFDARMNLPEVNRVSVSANIYSPVPPLPITGPQNQMQRRAQEARGRRGRLLNVARGYHSNYVHTPGGRHTLPSRMPCPHCSVQLWPTETGTVCCNSGQIVLPAFQEPPPELSQLFDNKSFIENIRRYKSVFAFTSMGASVKASDRVRQDRSVIDGRGPPRYSDSRVTLSPYRLT